MYNAISKVRESALLHVIKLTMEKLNKISHLKTSILRAMIYINC